MKNAIIVSGAAPFRQWYESHYLLSLGKKREVKSGEEDVLTKKRSNQLNAGRLLAAISSRPGQCGRADGYILEGRELEFYLKKIKNKKSK